MEKTKKYEIDMCEGGLVGKMLLFTLPLMASSLLQLLFNAADMMVAGRFAGDNALAAVSATGSLTNLIVSVFIGLSTGANVLIAKYFGQKSWKEVSETVHTAVFMSLLFGVILATFGFFMARPLLTLMKTPDDVINGSVTYMQIYFLGMPVIMLYNFTAAVLRAVGDTRRPLVYLSIAGVINVILNLFFVIVLKIGVAGVAIATVVSQAVSAILMVITLLRYDGALKLSPALLKITGNKLLQMLRIGLPAGIQGSLFSLSNVVIQSSINSFGSVAMNGNAAAANLEGFVYVGMNSFHHTALSFTSQNYGGRKWDRVKKVLGLSLLFTTISGVVLGYIFYFFREPLLGLYIARDAVYDETIAYGVVRMTVIMLTYFLCGTMDVCVGALRGIGHSVMPMLVSLTFACGLRLLWIATIFQYIHTLECLYISYPVSWFLATLVHLICYRVFYKKLVSVPEVVQN